MPNPVLKLDHAPRPRPRKRPSLYDALKIGFFFAGLPKNGFISVDVTDKCNLRCKHCYFLEQSEHAYQGELSVEQWVALFEHMRRDTSRLEFPFLQCTWVGGEPLIRKPLIERCKGFFRYNTVVTNGTIPLPDWPDVHFFVSVDGTEQVHDELRAKKGLYQRIKTIADRPELDVTIACCITSRNADTIEQLVKEWDAVPGVGHMVFDFYTPIETIEEPLWPGWEARDRTLDVLLALKELYGDFIITPARVFRLMKSHTAHRVTHSCLFAQKSTSFGPRGEVKNKCMIGERSDCERCGCVVPYYMHSLVDKRFILEDNVREAARALRRAGGRIGAAAAR
jgi:sulfatase maturation enzyme AslB (radical SAM superfamily)